MSFQSFSKLPPPPRNRPKNLPTPEFMATLALLCEDTDNTYDPRTHVLTLYDQQAFADRLREKLGRSSDSFAKQLRFLGFRRMREEQQERPALRYAWRGRREDFIAKELDFTQKQLTTMISRAAQLRNLLGERKARLDAQFEQSIFWGMNKSGDTADYKQQQAVRAAKETINIAHRLSAEIARDVQVNLENEISLLRLLSYRQQDLPDGEQ